MFTTQHHRLAACARHGLHLERLELRTMLSVSAGDQEPFAPGELLIGFEGEVAATLESQGGESALDLAQQVVGPAGLHSGRILYDLPTRPGQAARVATHWELPATANVQATAMQLSQLPGIAYAEPNVIMTSQSIPGDASFVGDWEFGVQEHLTQIGAPEAWDVTTGDPSVIVAVIDTGVDLDHPDLDDNLLAGKSFVEGTTTPQDDNGHGTQIAGLIAAEMDNLTELASEADGDATWAGGIVGVAPDVSILPVKVLDAGGSGRGSDIVGGIYYAVDPDGDPGTDDGADIITLSIGGGGFSQAMADAISYAYSQDVLVIASVAPFAEPGITYPAMDPYALAVTAVDADDVWDGINQTGSFVDMSAAGVDVLTTFVDKDDPSERLAIGGAYGRESGSSMSTPIVAGAAALIKSQHPDWGPSEIAGQLLATADSIDSVNSGIKGQLGAGRVNASAAVGPTLEPRVISLVGLGDTDVEAPVLYELEVGDVVDVRFSHAMESASVLDISHYELSFLGDLAIPNDDQTVDLSLVTEPLPPGATGVTDADNYYVPFAGRGVRLQVDGIQGNTALPTGRYRLSVGGISSINSGTIQSYTHDFQFASPTHFGPQQVIIQSDAGGPESVFAADIDGDGDMDMLFASIWDDKIAWYENIDGAGTFGPQRVITTQANGASSVFATDLDGDGDLDVLSASDIGSGWAPGIGNRIAWYENVDGAGTFGERHVIEASANAARSVIAADLDGDGDKDVLSVVGLGDLWRRTYVIAWYENTDGMGNFDARRVITTVGGDSVLAADLDGDKDLDVLSSYSGSGDDGGNLAWYENTDGAGTFGAQRVITTSEGAEQVHAADLDGDGDLDVLSGSDDKIAWYENINSAESFGPQRVITTAVDRTEALFASDLDGDGDVDVLSASSDDDTIAWYENTNGQGTFGTQRVITRSADRASSVFAADLDGDKDLDVLSASLNDEKVAWYQNTDGAGTFGEQRVLTARGADGAEAVFAADLDGDGDLDVLSASSDDDTIAWYENTNDQGTFGTQRVITTSADDAHFVSAADLDGDGDQDVLADTGWYENIDGTGNFGPLQVISTSSYSSAFAADLDGDGDLDVLYGSGSGSAWYENTDGAGMFGGQRVISADAAESVFAADLDGDGDLDVLDGTGGGGDGSRWYENTDGAGTFGGQRVIIPQGSWSVFAADLDGDGDVDVVLGGGDHVLWYENTDGNGNFRQKQVVIRLDDNGVRSVFAADLDEDGDLDLLSTAGAWSQDSTAPNAPNVAWYENIDGKGRFGSRQLITTTPGTPRSVYAADLDGDGDPDVLSASNGDDKIAWYENLLAHPGDANRDGQFDSADLVLVFKAGEYEDGVDGNSTWEEGDWNGDGDFDTGDLVAAFQKGLYERKSQVVASKIAAAVDWLFAEEDRLTRGRAYVA